MRSQFICVAAFVVLGLNLCGVVRADIEDAEVYVATCRKDGVNVRIAITLKPIAGFTDYGDYKTYTGLDGRVAPCQKPPSTTQDLYDYSTLEVITPWSSSLSVELGADGQGGFVPLHPADVYTDAHNLAFWDWFYDGYESPGSLDYSKNCHGYAFGVADWPLTAAGFVGSGWVPGEEPDDTGFSPVAVDPCTERPIVTSSEQMRESGTYTQNVMPEDPSDYECPDSVDIYKAHGIFNLFTMKHYRKHGDCFLKCARFATVVTDISDHSIKVTSIECQLNIIGCNPSGTAPPVFSDDDPVDLVDQAASGGNQ